MKALVFLHWGYFFQKKCIFFHVMWINFSKFVKIKKEKIWQKQQKKLK